MKKIPKDGLVLKESTAIPFNGTEIWHEQLDSLSVYKDVVLNKFIKDMTILRRPSSPMLVIVNLSETQLDFSMAESIVHGISALRRIKKVVFVGAGHGKGLIKKAVKSMQDSIEFAYECMDDCEKAKEWLAG